MASKRHWELLVASMPMLRAFVRRLVANSDAVDEILQEVSVRILASDGPRNHALFLAWSRGVARHVVALDWRLRQRARAELPLEDDAFGEVCRSIGDPEGALDARTRLARMFGGLDSEGLELLVRRYVLEETGKKLADERAQSPAALRMRLMRLRSTARAAKPQ